MFKVEETSSADGDITGIIFMRPDSILEGRIYRQPGPKENRVELPARFEQHIFTCTLAQARIIFHEELGCNGTCCTKPS